MDLRQISDDFFTIGNIAILQKKTGIPTYDFDFRKHFECKSVVSGIKSPVLLHIGAISDYAGVESKFIERGVKLLVNEATHLRCSTIEGWYSAIKERTPFTRLFDELPPIEYVLKDFTFPFFIKGNRQTNRHNKSQCIIESREAYEIMRDVWTKDSILSRQKVAIREYIPLKTIDDTSFPWMVPISYEFRFFYFERKCMAYGPYWTMGRNYSLEDNELSEVLKLTDWVAERLSVPFPAIDVAKTALGEWIVIEVNDAQESGFVGANPLKLWNNTMEAIQKRTWVSVDDLFEKGAVVLADEPLPDMTVDDIYLAYHNACSTREIVELFASVQNKCGFIRDTIYDFEEGTQEYVEACKVVDDWDALADDLLKRVMAIAEKEQLLITKKGLGWQYRLIPFMRQYGFKDGNGWWIKTYNPRGYENEQEKDALDRKLNNPMETVMCPRCEKEIEYLVIGNSISVECPSIGCIHTGIRGI